jgi:predicted RecB family nuclease
MLNSAVRVFSSPTATPKAILPRMQSLDGKLIYSATDLSSFLACPHLTLLKRRTALGGPKQPKFPDSGLDVLQARGLEHERKFLEGLRADGTSTIVDLTEFSAPFAPERWGRHTRATIDAMRAGADIVYQGMLLDGEWLGYPDFLRRVESPSVFGDWSYEVVDTKLAREAKGGALLQVLLYADLLKAIQGAAPEFVHLALGGPAGLSPRFRVIDYAAYFRSIRNQFLAWVTATPNELPRAVDPVAHCDICAWDHVCTGERREVDHLSFVAGISRRQRRALVEHGVSTLAGLGEMDGANLPRFDGLSAAAFARVQMQARIQLDGRRQNRKLHELLQPVVPEQGLAALPVPSPGDLFFDLEGDPYAFELGIEYLFGVVDAGGEYTGRWSLDRASEKQTFEWFIDLVMARLDTFPDLHIYHYAPYEPAALKRLAGRYDTRIDELDRLLRGKVFVDLYRVVRQGLRASVESYSIKKMEPFYDFDRQVDLRSANMALAGFEAWMQMGGPAGGDNPLLGEIEGYNRDDCLSTWKLREWLEVLREQLATESGQEVPRPSLPPAEAPEELSENLQEIRALMVRLMAGVPELPEHRSPEQQGRWLAAQMLEYHRRENKSMWWRYFSRLEMSDDELLEDASSLSGLEYIGVVGEIKRSFVHRYRFPAQEHKLSEGADTRDPRTGKAAGEITGLDDAAHTVDLKRGKTSAVAHPVSLIPYEYVDDQVMRSSLFRIGQAIAGQGFDRAGRFPSSLDLLMAAAPRVGSEPGQPLVRAGESTLDGAVRLARALDRSVLPVQGPPGSGKTYTGARMILALLRDGRKVGVTATSHKVISNLLNEICRAAREDGLTVKGIQKAAEEQHCGAGDIAATEDNAEILNALRSGDASLAAGTAWLWSREDMVASVDVLFIDEAGQFSLANALAVSPAAASLVLLGDPRQLEQPQQGLHPPGTDVSALDHLLGGDLTVPDSRGLFLDLTWRLHPDICSFTSELYYQDRLSPRQGLERQKINGDSFLSGSGLRWLKVDHAGNQNESPEEAARIEALVGELLGEGLTWTTADDREKKLELSDILVVAPYNAQVAFIRSRLPNGSRVGTVDKFQGQEAPIVIYSMASSSTDDAPRGMEFLYNPNRLNVATSRARCLVILVASGELFLPACRTPEQMRLANGLCRYRELAGEIE